MPRCSSTISAKQLASPNCLVNLKRNSSAVRCFAKVLLKSAIYCSTSGADICSAERTRYCIAPQIVGRRRLGLLQPREEPHQIPQRRDVADRRVDVEDRQLGL